MHWAELNPGVRLYHLIMVIYQRLKSLQASVTNHKILARHSGYERTGGRRVQTLRQRQLGRVGLVGRSLQSQYLMRFWSSLTNTESASAAH